MKKQLKRVAVIKNEHTKAQMSQLDDEWANYPGPYLMLAEVIAMEKAKQQGVKGDKNTSSD